MAAKDPVEEFKARTKGSASYFAEASRYLPAGVTASVKFYQPYPVIMKRARGSHLWDVDGNEYVDYCLGFGPMILGHGHPAVLKAIEEQMEVQGTTFLGTPHELELDMAKEILNTFRAAKEIRFTTSGTEATLHAMRLARAFTSKSKIGKFEGHYHGAVDEFLVNFSGPATSPGSEPKVTPSSTGMPSDAPERVVPLLFNDLATTERMIKRNSKELAAVILEPVMRSYIPAEEDFLKGLREITAELDIPLIFDEVMSGYRVRYGGAQHYYGVKPDITTLGKIIGGGLPCGAFLGREDIMEIASPLRGKGLFFHSSTMAGTPTVMAAGLATLKELRKEGVFDGLLKTSQTVMRGLAEVFEDSEVEVQVQGLGSVFSILFIDSPVKTNFEASLADSKKRRNFDFRMLNRGIFIKPAKPLYLSTAQTREDVERTLAAARATVSEMK